MTVPDGSSRLARVPQLFQEPRDTASEIDLFASASIKDSATAGYIWENNGERGMEKPESSVEEYI